MSFYRHRGSRVIKKGLAKAKPYKRITPSATGFIPGELLSSIAHFRFVLPYKCKAYSGLKQKCKFVAGLRLHKV